MKLIMFAVKDLAVQAYQVPQFVAHFGGAVRWFKDQCNKPDTAFGQHPEDYECHELGWFETDGGAALFSSAPGAIVRGKDLVDVAS